MRGVHWQYVAARLTCKRCCLKGEPQAVDAMGYTKHKHLPPCPKHVQAVKEKGSAPDSGHACCVHMQSIAGQLLSRSTDWASPLGCLSSSILPMVQPARHLERLLMLCTPTFSRCLRPIGTAAIALKATVPSSHLPATSAFSKLQVMLSQYQSWCNSSSSETCRLLIATFQRAHLSKLLKR